MGKTANTYCLLLKLGCWGFFDSAIVATEFKNSTSESFITHLCHHLTPFICLHLYKSTSECKIQPLTTRIGEVLSGTRALTHEHHQVAMGRVEGYASQRPSWLMKQSSVSAFLFFFILLLCALIYYAGVVVVYMQPHIQICCLCIKGNDLPLRNGEGC